MRDQNKNLEDMKPLSEDEISNRLRVNSSVAKIIKYAAENEAIISDLSLSNKDVAKRLGTSEIFVSNQRDLLIDYGFLKSKDKKLVTGKIKVVGYAPSCGGRTIMFNQGDMKAAGLNPRKYYYALVEPFSTGEGNGFMVRMFETRKKALDYKLSSKES